MHRESTRSLCRMKRHAIDFDADIIEIMKNRKDCKIVITQRFIR